MCVCACICVCVCMHARVCALSCTTVCDPMGPPDSSVHGILQARILEFAMSYSRESSWPGIKPQSLLHHYCHLRSLVEWHSTPGLGLVYFFRVINIRKYVAAIPTVPIGKTCSLIVTFLSVFTWSQKPSWPCSYYQIIEVGTQKKHLFAIPAWRSPSSNKDLISLTYHMAST